MFSSSTGSSRFTAALVAAACAVFSGCRNPEVTQLSDKSPEIIVPSGKDGSAELFRTRLAEDTTPAGSRDYAKRSMLVTVDEDVFENGSASVRKVGNTVVLRLFDTLVVTGTVKSVEEFEPGRYVVQGILQGVENGTFTMAFDNGALSAQIEIPGTGRYRIEFASDGMHRVLEETGITPPCRTESPTAAIALPKAADGLPPEILRPIALAKEAKTAAAVPYVDVAVFYTPAAVTEAGSVSALNSQIDLAISQANTAFTNSKVNIRVRLARREQVTYTETNIDQDLTRLQGKTDGYMDGIHALRDASRADLVCLWAKYPVDYYAGLGYIMDPNWKKTAFATYAFSVVVRKFATTSNTFVHELAHNMGCEHDIDNAYMGAYSYSLGHRFYVGSTQYRTVMAYAPGTSIPYFSNPSVLYSGVATGSSSRNNVLSLNNLKDTVALFRNALPTASISAPVSGTTYSSGASVTINANVTDPDGAISKVEFWRGTTLMGSDATSPYSWTWTGATSGTHSLTAKAFDNKGGTLTSGAVSITVNVSGKKTVNPSADSRVRDGSYAATNYGTSNPLEVQTSGTAGYNRDSHLRFSITSVSTVSAAKLRFYSNLSASGSVVTTVHDVASTTWIESGTGSITWNNKPARGTSRGTFTPNSTSLRWYEVDVTAYVKAQKTAGKTVVGFALHNGTAGSILVKVNSRESVTGKPELVLTP